MFSYTNSLYELPDQLTVVLYSPQPSSQTLQILTFQLSSVTQSCPTLCDPMNCSMPGLAVHHQLPELTQTHVHRVSDAIQPSHPLLSPSPPAPNPSQHQSLFQWVNFAWGGQSTGGSASASFLPKKSQGWSPSEWTGWISLQSKGLSRVFSNTTVQKHQFFGTPFFTAQLSHPYMTTGKTIALTRRTFVGKVTSLLLSMLSRLVITFLPRSKRLLIPNTLVNYYLLMFLITIKNYHWQENGPLFFLLLRS